MKKKYKVNIEASLDYIIGYLKYGHLVSEIELTEEEFKKFEENPLTYINELEENGDLDSKIVIDDYVVEDYGKICEIDCYDVTEVISYD